MSSPHGLTNSPLPRAHSVGLHINPIRRSSSSVSSEFIKIRHTPARMVSETVLVSSPTSELDDEVIVGERSPLISGKHLEEGGSAVFMDTFLRSRQDNRSYSFSSSVVQAAKKKGYIFWFKGFKILALFGITLLCCHTGKPFAQHHINRALHRKVIPDGCLKAYAKFLPAGESLMCVRLYTVLVRHDESEKHLHVLVTNSTPQEFYRESYDKEYPILELTVQGPFHEEDNNTVDRLTVQLDDKGWALGVNKTALKLHDIEEFRHKFRCPEADQCSLKVNVSSDDQVPLTYTVHKLSTVVDNEIIYAALILGFVYLLIIFDLVHRTVAAMLGALAALAVLSAINERPSTETILSWMEMQTLMLLFGMMIIVAVLSETGIFDYSALKAYKLADGKVWPLVTLLCAFSAVVSAFLDNVTTILLMAPVTIRLCEVLNLDPRVILIAEVLFSNIGGTATAIGDPPNVIIVSALEGDGLTFTVFTSHLVIGVVFITVVAYGFLRLYYRNMQQLSNPNPPEIVELNHEIQMWRRAASRLAVVTREETVMKALFLQKAVELENFLNKTLHRKRRAEKKDLNEQLRQLEKEYRIKDMGLLLKCIFVLLVVMTFFFMYSFVSSIHIDLGWIAVIGAIWLLVIADLFDLESILHRVEWATLIFFAALFILMEALAELGLIEWIGDKMTDMIVTVDEEYRLAAALIIIAWISALASSFIDNIPFTTAMIPVLKQLSKDPNVGLDLLPLVIALALGACLGGNGTLIGASANVVCAGIAEQHGYTITFKQFFKVGFPMMLVTVFVASIYLLICHSAIKWNDV